MEEQKKRTPQGTPRQTECEQKELVCEPSDGQRNEFIARRKPERMDLGDLLLLCIVLLLLIDSEEDDALSLLITAAAFLLL